MRSQAEAGNEICSRYNRRMIYLDNHATTAMDPAVLAAMLPYFTEQFANSGSVTHEFGRQVQDDVQTAMEQIGSSLNCSSQEIVVTSGATEAANLAIFGVCQHARQTRRKIVSVKTEHRAVLDPIERLQSQGFEVCWLPIDAAGVIDLEAAAKIIDDETAIVCVMLVNNEIGTIQNLSQIGKLCRIVGAVLFSDATAAIGRLSVDVQASNVDLIAWSAHKSYGPKGIGGLYVRNDPSRIRLRPQIVGGGQQRNLRSGTLNVPGLIAMAEAFRIADSVRLDERQRIHRLQQRLLKILEPHVELNGPPVTETLDEFRVAENLNVRWAGVEGQSLMLRTPQVCISSGSACSSAQQTVSHVLTAVELNQDAARSSTRFGLGRFTTSEDIDSAAQQLLDAYQSICP